MNDQTKVKISPWKLPLMVIVAVLMILAMLRLGVWQLARADEKRTIVEQLKAKSNLPALTISELIDPTDFSELRFRKVDLSGRYLADKSVFVDNQVVNGKVGYQVFTPFELAGSAKSIMIARGFIGVGASRETLPDLITIAQQHSIIGRLNRPPAKPPLWSDEYPVAEGNRWQFLPISELAQQLHLDLFPLVVELAPNKTNANAGSAGLIQKWSEIDDQWVAKHQGYAFQWFAMAAAFFVACLVLLIRTTSRKT